MPPLITLNTPRLRLRPFALSDAADVQRLAGDHDVASTTRLVPHPYEDGMAEQWLAAHQAEYDDEKSLTLAITERQEGHLIGSITLVLGLADKRAELGYWLGKPYWGQGYCPEAAQALMHWGFETLNLNRIFAHHLSRNPASGRVLQKIGMQHEGRLREHNIKWGKFEDVDIYGILRSELSVVDTVIKEE